MIQMQTVLDVADNSGREVGTLHQGAGRIKKALRDVWETLWF